MPKKKAHIRALAALLGKTTRCKDCGYFERGWGGWSNSCKLSGRNTKLEKTCKYFTFEVQSEEV